MSGEVTNTSDVIIQGEGEMTKPLQSVCKFNQNGFCKFGQSCKIMHINIICSNSNCKKHMRNFRHPRACRYFAQKGHCKRGSACAYSHKRDLISVHRMLRVLLLLLLLLLLLRHVFTSSQSQI